MTKWIAITFLFFACTAEASGEIQVGCRRLVPYALTAPAPMILQAAPVQPQIMQVVPVQPQVLAVPATVSVQTYQAQSSLRWGILKRRLVPRTRYVPGPVLNYQLTVPAN